MLRRLGRPLAIGVVYFAVIFFGHLPDHLILFPSTARMDGHGAIRKTIPLEENGDLEIWTARSQRAGRDGRPDIYVLRFYGNADRAENWVAAEAEAWNGRAVEIWGMNYPGFGGSTGPAQLKRVGPAGLAAFDALQKSADGPSYRNFRRKPRHDCSARCGGTSASRGVDSA